ncbi:pirin family protein [Altibacter sp. HG106]|uniref:pirin family protein n=1 Tax=Altibacter sp. HG106 TaxID=3023937 RepID=UPI0023508567|nr:pirin family protein [Altibacter sp. HG106]MDC7993763.1 pirin family protein [Altibacter sp. HG106]
MKKILHTANTRGSADYGWLQANYSFSFANYFDPKRLQFGLLRVMNDDTVAPGMGFGKHPHENMEIVTIPQTGALKHRDSMGNEGIIQAGDIQVMSAGSGVEHSEINASSKEPVTLFQIWVFPETENVAPRYDQKKIASLLQPNQLATVVAPKDVAKGEQLWVHQQAYFSLGDFSEKTSITYQLHNKSHGAYVFVIEGAASVADEHLEKRDAVGVWDTHEVALDIAANSRILVIEIPMN